MAITAVFCLNAQQPQQPQMHELPLNPKVKSGVLPNGLHYYVLHNEEPKERANFYIAQKVGSTLETQEQLGLAHFLEHMAFNGTTNYPGKNMLNYLQNKGIRFGADINAYTGFDETVYNINNVPSTDKALMDSVLLCLRDWSCGILLEESEIDAERGVIQEEWRQRNDAQFRMMETILPKLFQDYQYQQMPIGKMEVVRNFPPKVIRDYYHKWYRPDQQGIVVVGDFDADEMEKKVIEMFSTIPMPENAAPRTYPAVSDNEKPIYAYFEDPELKNIMVTIAFKSDKMPFEMRNTQEYYVQNNLILNVFSKMINNRLADEARKADCPFGYAGVYFGKYMVASTKDAFDITIIPKTDVEAAVRSAMSIVAQACKTGFLPSELTRAKDELLATYEKAYNERDKTNSNLMAKSIIRHFIDNEPEPGIELEYQLAQGVLNGVPVDMYNMIGAQLLTDNNQVMVVSRPAVAGQKPLDENVMTGILSETIKAQYEPYVDEVITDPLIPQLPAPGKITGTSQNADFGTTEFTLSNGTKVVVKTTDFAQDQILFSAQRQGGLPTYEKSQADNLNFVRYAYEASKMGNFKRSTLEKYLAGKKVALQFGVGNGTDYFSGATTVKDLPTFMEMVYASFALLSPDAEEWKGIKSQIEMSLVNADKDPQTIFFKRNTKNQYGNNPLTNSADLASLNASDYDQMLQIIKNATANAADYTFVFTGNVDVETLKPLLEKYIASLPSKAKTTRKAVSNIDVVIGNKVNDIFTTPMTTPATFVFDTFSGKNLPYNIGNEVRMTMASDILDMVYIKTLREELGGTYGAMVSGAINPNTGQWEMIYFFQTNKELQDVMIKRAYDEWIGLLKNGANEEDFSRVKEAMLKQYDINVRNNQYWLNWIGLYNRGFNMYTGRKAAIEKVTLKDLNDFMKKQLLPQAEKNRIQTVMEGVEQK